MNLPSFLTASYFFHKVFDKKKHLQLLAKTAFVQRFHERRSLLYVGFWALFSCAFLLLEKLITGKGFVLIGYTACIILLTAVYLRLAEHCLQRNYIKKIDTLEKKLQLAHSNKIFLRKQVLILRQKNHNYQTSRRALKQLHEKISLHQKKQAKAIAISLNILKKSLLNPRNDLPQDEQINILHTTYQGAEALSKGLWYTAKRETIDLKDILDDVSSLFSEKIHGSRLTLEITLGPILSICSFKGDSLLTELLLVNVVGKALYQAPAHSKISIEVDYKSKFLCLQIQGKSYKGVQNTEKPSQKAFHFFIEDVVLQRFCLEQNIQYYYTTKEEEHLACIMIPIQPVKDLPNNVVPLFS